MNPKFNFESYKESTLFHLKYGRGAIIIAIASKHKSAKHIAKIFNQKERNHNGRTDPEFDEIISIKENGDHVQIKIKMKFRYPNKPSYKPIDAIITRIIPVKAITFEIINDVEIG